MTTLGCGWVGLPVAAGECQGEAVVPVDAQRMLPVPKPLLLLGFRGWILGRGWRGVGGVCGGPRPAEGALSLEDGAGCHAWGGYH